MISANMQTTREFSLKAIAGFRQEAEEAKAQGNFEFAFVLLDQAEVQENGLEID